MKKFLIISIFVLCSNTFAGIYKIYDNEKECTLYFSESSSFSKDIDIQKLKRTSVSAALVFQKSDDRFNLKGLWSFMPLVLSVNLEEDKEQHFMGSTFESICLSADKRVIYSEVGRRLFNNLNDLDRE
ncbi:hypothetical protein [Halobacteriovorax sp. HLS]|uniref:hypothetical protein n=1 Tax=Halobacteriovorax sp. HLS TaxID=2234000 RepID=UPI000FD9479D|nr:hypothetical protein [Halobacteriovorax sp. HLS]